MNGAHAEIERPLAAGGASPERAPRATVPPIDCATIARSLRFFGPIAKKYFRSEVRGMERVPRAQTLLVTHHDGGVLPINGICFGVAWYERFGCERPMYVLTHDLLHRMWPGFNRLMRQSGLVPADRSTMDATLATGESVLVFPGAARETFRTYKDRREIDLGGRTGFVAQAIRWGIPITPIVSAGSHETVIVLARGSETARKLGIPKLVRSADVLPILGGLPWGIWALPFLPQIPLPAKITTEVLAPMRLDEALGRKLRREDASDAAIVRAGFDAVLDRMKRRLAALYDERRWPVIG